MPRKSNPFRTQRNGKQYLHVHVDNIATIVIKREDEGIVIDVYPFNDLSAEPVTSTWAHHHDLLPQENPPSLLLPPWIRTALMRYDMGVFAYLTECTSAQALQLGLRDCGDSLVRFIVSELSPQEDCESYDTAIQRVTTARNQLSDLIDDLQEDANAPPATTGSPRYRLGWFIDSDAVTPLAAVQEALHIQRNHQSTATVFTVRENDTGKITTIDLTELQPQ